MGKDLKGNKLGVGFGQRKDGIYYYRFTNRFDERVTIYNKKLSQLRKEAKILESKNTMSMNSSNTKITVNELFDLWIDIFKKNDLKESTIANYKTTYNNYVRDSFLGNYKVYKVTPLIVKKLYNELVEKYSQTICGAIRSILIGMFDLAVLECYIFRNDLPKLKITSKKKKKVVKALTLEEQRIFLEYSKYTFHYNLYVLVLNTGLRVGEALALEFDDIDLKRRIIYVRKNLQYQRKGTFANGTKYKFDTPKNGQERVVPINDNAYKAICDQYDQLLLIKSNKLHWRQKKYQPFKGFENLVFINRTGTPIQQSWISNNIRNIVEKINKDDQSINMRRFNLHVLRHTFATRCVEYNIPLNVVSDYLGHSDIKLTAHTYVDSNVYDYNTICAIDNIYNNNNSGLVS